MKTRQIIILLAPGLCFVMFAFLLLFESAKNNHILQTQVQDQQIFEKFISDVKSGKRQMTTDLWIGEASAKEALLESEREYIRINARTLQHLGLWALVITALHVWVVFSVRNDLRKRNNSTAS